MRVVPFVLILAAACASTPQQGRTARAQAPRLGLDQPLRVVYRQYYQDSNIFIMENLAGRDLVKLRSRKLEAGEQPIAYVPDDVMAEMLKEFRRHGYYKWAGPRPANPIKVGATGEITLIDQERRMTSLLRRKASLGTVADKDYVHAAQSYVDCTKTYLAVWDHFRPLMQATSSDGNFGVKKAEFDR